MVMCTYNRVNGVYACENKFLLLDVLRRDWRCKGSVMSDWGAVHSTEALLNGLDKKWRGNIDQAVLQRLIGWRKPYLEAGEATMVTVTANPRFIGEFYRKLQKWIILKDDMGWNLATMLKTQFRSHTSQ